MTSLKAKGHPESRAMVDIADAHWLCVRDLTLVVAQISYRYEWCLKNFFPFKLLKMRSPFLVLVLQFMERCYFEHNRAEYTPL